MKQFRQFEGKFHALLGIEAGVTVGLVVQVQVVIQQLPAPAGALSHILSGQFQVNTARAAPFSRVNPVEGAYFGENVIKIPRFLPITVLVGIAVHRVATPDNLESFPSNLPDQLRQTSLYFLSTEPGDEGQPSRFIGGIEFQDELFYIFDIGVRPDLEPERVANPAEELYVGAINLAGPVADPEHVGAAVIPLPGG